MDTFSDKLHLLSPSLLATSLDNLPTLAAVVWVLSATLWDLATRRIPNGLTVSGALLGLALQVLGAGWPGLLDGLAGLATGFFIFLPLYACGWMGAGDVKLMAAVGSFLGWSGTLLAVTLSSGLGAVFAFMLICVRGGALEYLTRYGHMLKCLLTTGRTSYVPPPPGSAATRSFPYAGAIALGTVVALMWTGRFEPFLRAAGLHP